MARLLAVDTSAQRGSVALAVDDEVIVEHSDEPRSHTRLLEPMMNRLLARAGLRLNHLDGLAYGRGPGSFTGLRITAGVVQGIAWGLDCRVVPVSSLAAMALSVSPERGSVPVASALDARMGEVYWSCYRVSADRTLEVLVDDCLLLPGELSLPSVADPDSWVGVGTGWQYRDAIAESMVSAMTLIDADVMPDAADVARLALPELARGNTVDAVAVQPSYIRDDVGWQKTPGR